MNTTRLAVSALCTALAFAPIRIVHAQTSKPGIASQLFDAGRDLMKNGDYATACPKLAQSAKLEPRVGTLGRLAECEEKLGHLAAARGHWQDTVDLAKAQKDDRAAHAGDELARVDAIVPRVIVSMASPPPNVDVKLDDLSIGAASLGLPLPVDPGSHTIAVAAPHKTTWSATIESKADGSTSKVDVPPLEDAKKTAIASAPVVVPPPKRTVEPPPAKEETTHPLRTVGVVTAVVGGVVVLAGGGLGLVASSKANDSYGEGCTKEGKCSAGRAADDHDSARTFAGFSTIGFIAGGVLVAAGAVLFIVAPKKVQTMGLLVGPNGLGGRF